MKTRDLESSVYVTLLTLAFTSQYGGLASTKHDYTKR